MNTWILQHFLNPAFFWPGMALLSLPIIIHLINRLRFRRVRFAAMEFLLASEKRNRRRILLEQLLLLLMRIAIVLLVVLLIGRLIVDPEQISLFQGAKSHHVVIVDDTASMQERDGEETVFDAAKEAVRRIVAEGARRPGTQLLTMILMSAPEETVSGLSQRAVDEALLAEISDRLEVLECTHQTADPADALEAARQRLADDRSALRYVHVLSDFRQSDWIDNKGAVSVLRTLGQADVGINLVRCIADEHENLGITDLGGAVEVAAAGVPVSLEATVRNWGTRDQEGVTASLFVNGRRLPRVVDFQTVPAGDEVTRRFDVVFETAEPHAVRLSLSEDALDADNIRHLAVDVPVENPVLIVDGSPGSEQGLYLTDALAADRSVTGFAPAIVSPEEVRRTPLERFHLIYMVNVPELAPDALAALESYVNNGGGLIWYMGDAVRPAYYNESLFDPDGGLFPVRIGLAPERLERDETRSPEPDLEPVQDPLFRFFTDAEVPILDLVFINLFYPLADGDEPDGNVVRDALVHARLRNGAPLMLEHTFGQGRVFTCLTSAGPLRNSEGTFWNNWASGPASFSFVVFQLELAKRLVRKDRSLPQLASGEPIELTFNRAVYQPEVEVTTPDERVSRVQATQVERDEEASDAAEDVTRMQVLYRETDRPGVYSLALTTQDQERERRLFAVNVPAREGALALMEDDALLQELGEEVSVEIQPAGTFDWIRSESPGSEVRWLLLVLLGVICIAEQMLASRLSYQSE